MTFSNFQFWFEIFNFFKAAWWNIKCGLLNHTFKVYIISLSLLNEQFLPLQSIKFFVSWDFLLLSYSKSYFFQLICVVHLYSLFRSDSLKNCFWGILSEGWSARYHSSDYWNFYSWSHTFTSLGCEQLNIYYTDSRLK